MTYAPLTKARAPVEHPPVARRRAVPPTPGEHRDEAVGATNALAAVRQVLSGPAERLEPGTRRELSHHLGHSLGQVRIHAGTQAAESARLVGASAFTVGQNIVFGASRYEPRSSAGRRLLIHELAHTIQQPDVSGAGDHVVHDAAGSDLEQEADRAASGHGGAQVLRRLSTPTLQRQTDDAEGYDITLTYPPDHTERHQALAPAAAATVLARFANRIEMHIEGAYEGHSYLREIHEDQWIVAGISDVLGGRSIPSLDIWSWPRSLLRLARASMAGGMVQESARELQMAAQATRSAERRVYEYREGTISGAERAVFGLQVVQVASAAVVTVGTGGTAGVLVGAGLTGAQRLAGEAAAVHLGLQQEIDWAGIAFDTIFAAVAGRFAGRLGSAVAARLAVRLGSQITANAITALLVGRASGIVHAGTRELFDALRGRTNLTLEQFIDRLSDQLTLRAAFLDLVAYAAGSAASRAPGPGSNTAPPGPPPARSDPAPARLTPLAGDVPGRVPMRDGKVLSTPRPSSVGPVAGARWSGGSAAPALDPLPAPVMPATPAVRGLPTPAAEPTPAMSTPPGTSDAPQAFSGVAVAAATAAAGQSRTQAGTEKVSDSNIFMDRVEGGPAQRLRIDAGYLGNPSFTLHVPAAAWSEATRVDPYGTQAARLAGRPGGARILPDVDGDLNPFRAQLPAILSANFGENDLKIALRAKERGVPLLTAQAAMARQLVDPAFPARVVAVGTVPVEIA